MQSLNESLSSLPIFHTMDESELSKLERIANVQTYQKKSNIIMEGEESKAVYFIHKGIVKIYKVDTHGNEQIINFLRDGAMFPHSIFFDDDPYSITAEVVEDATLSVLPIRAFEQVVIENPGIMVKVMHILGRKIRDLQTKIQEFSANDVNLRIIAILIRLTSEHGVEQKNGILINLQLTNQEVAYMAGTTRESVNRQLNQLKKNGIISVKSRKMTVHQLSELQAYLP